MTSGWNFTAAEQRSTSWTSYNKPKLISQSGSGKQSEFWYGADRSRFKQVSSDGTDTTTRIYIGGLYEKEVKTVTGPPAGTDTTHHYYIRAGGSVVALIKSRENVLGTDIKSTRYLHRDHLGSLTYITDETGAVIEERSHDPHGKRRNTVDWSDATTQIFASETMRSFTGHESLDDVALIHMNGRIYDPDLGRFMSADPHVQSEQNTQALNRYSYVLNNPLSYTDPSGFFFKGLFKAIKKIFKKIFKNRFIRTIAAIAAYKIPYIGPFVAGYISSGGDIKSAIISAITAQAFSAIGSHFDALKVSPGRVTLDTPTGFLTAGEKLARVVSHGAVGAAAAAAQGGNVLAGFASAGFAKAFTPIANDLAQGNEFLGLGLTALSGGAASALGGGKFSNGALTAASGYLFNYLQLAGPITQALSRVPLLARLGKGIRTWWYKYISRRIGNVYDSITATQGTVAGTSIPKSFEIATHGGARFWVNPNAAKHMVEYISRTPPTSPGTTMASQAMLTSFRAAISQASRQGIQYGQMIKVGQWELMFAAPRAKGLLPVVKHALYK